MRDIRISDLHDFELVALSAACSSDPKLMRVGRAVAEEQRSRHGLDLEEARGKEAKLDDLFRDADRASKKLLKALGVG